MVRNKTDTNSELFKEGYDVAMYKIPVEADSAIESEFPWLFEPCNRQQSYIYSF